MAIVYSILHIFHATELFCHYNSNFKVVWSSLVDTITFSFFVCVYETTQNTLGISQISWVCWSGVMLLEALLGKGPSLLDLQYFIRTQLSFSLGEFWVLVNTENLSWGENFPFLYVEWGLIYVLCRGQMISQSTAWHDSTWNILPLKMCPGLSSGKGRFEEWWVDEPFQQEEIIILL